jgi:hypothetical protein
MTDSGSACPHPALRAPFSPREKGRSYPSPSGRRWTRKARPDEGKGCRASPPQPVLRARERPRAGPRKRLAFVSTVLTLAAFSSGCVPEPGTQIAPDCVARVNKAALQAMKRTGPLGQMQIFGAPTSFGPYLKRVEVRVFGGRTDIYAVDVTINNACNILGVSTRLETNYWNLR